MVERIAILGWGSLLWEDDPKFDWFNQQRTSWDNDGPELPLEFSRVSDSRNRALTLVIDPSKGTRCRVAYALSKRQTLAEVIEDLAKRESITNQRNVGRLQISSATSAANRTPEVLVIEGWARRKNVTAVVWTALKSNFRNEVRKSFSVTNAVEYVCRLSGEGRSKAKEYVEYAPEFIQVPTRLPLIEALTEAVALSGGSENPGASNDSAAEVTRAAPGSDVEGHGKDRKGMSLDEYQNKHFPVYEAFANTVRFILEQALQTTSGLPRPQSIQSRAKSVESVRRRLAESGRVDTAALEMERRDLAGVRLIFYTNNDVDRFLASPLVRDNFEIEEDSTKIHHPTPEKEGTRYRAIHYTVRLREDRTRLPEYRRFAGMRCEIQVQTILNHAWSETSHDIIYKGNLRDGYGGRAMKAITRRFERIMDEYLKPAGFEIQKAQQEYERVLQGKALFDKDIGNLLDNARNNNERYEILSGLKDYAIPNYDDLAAAYAGLKEPLLRAVKAARATALVPIETTYGSMGGFKTEMVTKLVVEIVERLQYADIVGTLQLLIDIYRDEPSDNIRQQITNAVKNLSEYNIDAYNQVGLMLQSALVDHLASMTDADVDAIRPIALTIWTEAIQSDITSAKWKVDSVTLSTGALPASDQLVKIRDKAIKALFAAYDRSTEDAQKRAILSALDAATRTPSQAQYSNELLQTTLKDTKRIVDFVTERAKATSYELLQHLEHTFLYDHFRAKEFAEDPGNRFGCQADAAALVSAVFNFRDTINADDRFVRYKVLVGFESVYPDHWTDKEFGYKGAEEHRRAEATLYIEEISAANENEWFDLIVRCAETKTNDSATFPVFGNFISKLAERKPEVGDRFLAKAPNDLRNFLAGFLNGLALSGRRDIYERVLEGELESARSLAGIARHLRYSDTRKPDFADRLLKRAIEKADALTVIECLLFALEHFGTEKIADSDTFLRDAFTFLNERKDPRWVSEAWFLQKTTRFYEEMTPERIAQVLESLGYLRQVNYQVERVLVRLAERQLEAVWDYFGARLAKEVAGVGEDQERFEAVPFEFHGLEKQLSKDPQLAIKKGLAWFARDSRLFQFRGGRILSNTFPNCTPQFADALAELVTTGGDTEVDFALAILQNYRGEVSTHSVLREIVSRFSEDKRKMSAVRIVIESTGVVSGDLGFADAWRARKELLSQWLEDERQSVKAFAEKHISEMDRMIASEHRRAESQREMWKRDFEEDAGGNQG